MNSNNLHSVWDDFPDLISTTPFDIGLFTALCRREDKIIDLGCSYGRACKMLEDLGYTDITGVDSSKMQLERAREILVTTNLYCADVQQLPFRDEQFDHAISFGVVNCLLQKDELRRFIVECHRVLRADGLWFLNMYSRNESPYFLKKYREGVAEFGVKGMFRSNSGIIFRHYLPSEFLNLSDEFFRLIRCERKRFLSMHGKRRVNGYSFILKRNSIRNDQGSSVGDMTTWRFSNSPRKWEFNEQVANIFDHHVRWSVPFYEEIHRMVSEISDLFIKDGSTIVDIGTSTGQAVINLYERHKNKTLNFYAVDKSEPMLAKARQRCSQIPRLVFVNKPIEETNLPCSDLVLSLYTMQFIRPDDRAGVIRKIFESLNLDGGFLMAEKVKVEECQNNIVFTKFHEDLKRRLGVSDDDIREKRKALKNVLIPLTVTENRQMLEQGGFRSITLIFVWYNWMMFLARK
ncbi:MAG: class I SAM-dependent methyltransferase [Deltaproteobacteria bacterium]|nr:class I SAM-dependent methyltransferase [Deltaproteobacteria bacterium]